MGIKSVLKWTATALSLFFGFGIASFFFSIARTHYNAGAVEKAIKPGMAWDEAARVLEANKRWNWLAFNGSEDKCGMIFQDDGKYQFKSLKLGGAEFTSLTDAVARGQAASCSGLTVFFMGLGQYTTVPVKLSSATVVSIGSVRSGP